MLAVFKLKFTVIFQTFIIDLHVFDPFPEASLISEGECDLGEIIDTP